MFCPNCGQETTTKFCVGCGIGGIGVLVDLITILVGSYTDKFGNLLVG